MRLGIVFRTLCVLLATGLPFVDRAFAQDAQGQDSVSYIRDAEIEGFIRTFATPIWKAAGLDPQAWSAQAVAAAAAQGLALTVDTEPPRELEDVFVALLEENGATA